MISAPWNVILTIVFTYTALVCTWHLVAHRRHTSDAKQRNTDALVSINHILMSAAMIWMTWSMESPLALWVQAALFAALTVGLLMVLRRGAAGAERGDLLGHIGLNAAMIWMLAAMEPLMADAPMEMPMGEMEMPMGHGGMPQGQTPLWADVINVGFVALSLGVALWFTRRAAGSTSHRLHLSCHAVMGFAMAAMLVLMN